MKRNITATILALLCIYFDSIFFANINIYDVRPDTMLCATVSFAVLCGSYPGAIFGALGGLMLDVIASRYIGLSASMYLIAGLAGGFFYKKFYADNVIVPAATAAAISFLKELFYALFVMIQGTRFAFASILLRYILPSAVVTGLICILIHLILKRLLVRQVKRSPVEKPTR